MLGKCFKFGFCCSCVGYLCGCGSGCVCVDDRRGRGLDGLNECDGILLGVVLMCFLGGCSGR